MSNPLHPIVGPEDYISPYDDINYSKGPKIIYGDVDVFTVVLNDAQSDADDEWGRTEQIALRMIIDEAIAVHKELFGWAGILGIKDKFDVLAGMFVGLGPNFDHPELSVLTIGNTSLADGTLTVGTGSFFNAISLSLNNGVFTTAVDPITSSVLLKATEAISGKSASLLLYPTSSGSTVILNLSGTTTPDNYRFVNSGSSHYFEMPYDARVGGILTASTINATTISCYSFSTTGDLTGANLTLTGTDALATITLSPTKVDNKTLIQCTDNGTTATLDIYTDILSLYQYYKTAEPDPSAHKVLFYEKWNWDSNNEYMLLRLLSDVQIEGRFYINGYTGPVSGDIGTAAIHLYYDLFDVILKVWDNSGVPQLIISNCTIFDFGGDIDTADNGVRILAGADSENPNTPWTGFKVRGLVDGNPTQLSVAMDILTGRVQYTLTEYYYGLVFTNKNTYENVILDKSTNLYLMGADYTAARLEITNSSITIKDPDFTYFQFDTYSLTVGAEGKFYVDTNGVVSGDTNTALKWSCVTVDSVTWPASSTPVTGSPFDLHALNANVPSVSRILSVNVTVYDIDDTILYTESDNRFLTSITDSPTSLVITSGAGSDITAGHTVNIKVTFLYN